MNKQAILNNAAVQLAAKTNYLNRDIVYLKNVPITAYDIKSAGFSVIKFKKLMPADEIKNLEQMPKEERNIYIGKRIIREPKINEEILNTLEKVRQAFVLVNRIPAENILSIKKDALFLIKTDPRVSEIKDFFKFRVEGKYSSYLYVNRKEFYYDSMNDELEIKGIPDEIKKLQRDYLLKDIKQILKMAEKLGPEQLLQTLKSYRRKYLRRELHPETYRNLETGQFAMGDYFLETIGEDELEEIDISQNYINYIVPIIQALL